MSAVPETIREQVRRRAQGACEYCRKPEIASAYPHHVEHIIPRRHGGSSDPDNLAWACFQCNVAKGTDVGSYDEATGELTALFNPRSQRWDDHFQLANAAIVGRTPVGRVTVALLQMNHPQQIETRSRLMRSGRWPG